MPALFGLWAVAVAQPLLDLLARHPEFFVAHRADRTDILVMTAGLVLAGPAAMTAAVWLVGLAGARARKAAEQASIALLAAVLVAQVAARAGVPRWELAAVMAAAAGAGAAVAWARSAAARLFGAVLAIGVLVVPAAFLARPAIRRALAWNGGEARPLGVERVPPPAGSRAETPVVLAVLDELPLVSLLNGAREIDPVFYPHIAALARDGVWYRNATTVSDFTRWALPSIVTGKYPVADLVPTAEDYPDTLFTFLARTHRMESAEGLTRLCPSDLCGAVRAPAAERAAAIADDLRIMFLHVVSPPDLRARLPDLTEGWAGFGPMETREERQRRQFRRRGRADWKLSWFAYLQRISARDRQPTFYFIHSLVPHAPHLDLPTGQRNATRAAIPGWVDDKSAWSQDEWAVVQFHQRHLMQMSSVDGVVGRLIERLKAAGLYDRALVVLTSDHGSAFQPGFPRRQFTEATAAAIMRVPLIIKYPEALGVSPAVSDRNVELVDIAPTVADVLGLELPWKADGVSLLRATAAERASKRIYHRAAQSVHTYDARGPDDAPLLRHLREMFGGPDNRYRVPRPPRHHGLLGRAIAGFPVEEDSVSLAIDRQERFTRMDPEAYQVPFDVAGRVEPPAAEGRPAFVAVAVNGTIEAVTRTWDTEPGRWLATPPLDAWRKGWNDLQAFVIEEAGGKVVLKR